MKQARQGDVFIEAHPQGIPASATRVPLDGGRVILAYGERTGHAHAFAAEDVQLFALGNERFVRVLAPRALAHEEHNAIPTPPGDYRVIQQREYHPQEIERPVRD